MNLDLLTLSSKWDYWLKNRSVIYSNKMVKSEAKKYPNSMEKLPYCLALSRWCQPFQISLHPMIYFDLSSLSCCFPLSLQPFSNWDFFPTAKLQQIINHDGTYMHICAVMIDDFIEHSNTFFMLVNFFY